MPIAALAGGDPVMAASFERQEAAKVLWEREFTWDQEALDR